MSGTPPAPGEPSAPHADELRAEVAQLHEALRSQRDIGMAIGLLSAGVGCSTEQAWRTMLRLSQDSNTKVRAVARALVTVHDGTAGEQESADLDRIAPHLPVSGWPRGTRSGDDAAP
jgi:hypothetical protein